jgi:hypothetical protein
VVFEPKLHPETKTINKKMKQNFPGRLPKAEESKPDAETSSA